MFEPWNVFPTAAPDRVSRRQALKSASGGFGISALAGLLGRAGPRRPRRDRAPAAGPLAPKPPHFRVEGQADHLPVHGRGDVADGYLGIQAEAAGRTTAKSGPGGGTLTASKFKFAQHGQTGTWVSELFPNMAKHVDKLCFIRGLHTDTPAHPQAVIQLHTGTALALARPGRRWAPGCCMAWAPRTRICPAISRSIRRRISAGPSTTAARFCPPISRARASTTPATCPT